MSRSRSSIVSLDIVAFLGHLVCSRGPRRPRRLSESIQFMFQAIGPPELIVPQVAGSGHHGRG